MKSYVINLERATSRRNTIQKEFDFYGIQFEFFPGVDWKKLSEKEIVDNSDSRLVSKLPNPVHGGGLGCWLSHRKVWKMAIRNGEKIIAVFEDDAKLTSETKLALESLSSPMIHCQFDIVFLYNGKLRNPLIPACNLNDSFTLNLIKYDSVGTVGYVITQSAMFALLNKYKLMDKPIDVQMHYYWQHGLKTYILTPQVVFHGKLGQVHHSYIKETRDDQGHGINRKKKIHYKVVREIKKFCKMLYPKYIPQLIAFRKRVKTEAIREQIM